MENFQQFIDKERQRLTNERQKLLDQKAELDNKIAAIDQEMKAIDAYERAKTGKTTTRTSGKRRSGVRDDVLKHVKSHPQGIARAALLEEMGVKGDRSGEQSVSNALAALKKSGAITAQDGVYKAA